jgi:pimeloyl-ACP methyl ester carboxylesterase
LTRAFLQTPHGQIHYRSEGTGDPPLVLLHQTPRSLDDYAEAQPLLARRRRVVAMDTIGYGDSDKPAGRCTIEDYAEMVVGLLDDLGAPVATIVGHHTGSKIAVEVAAAYPERVDRLVLLGPYFWRDEERARGLAQVEAWGPVELQGGGSHLVQLWQEAGVFAGGDPQWTNRAVVDTLKAGTETLHRGHWASARYDQEARLPLIRCPTLIVWGERDVAEHDEAGFHTEGLADAIGGSRVAKLSGELSGSMIPNRMPDEFARLVLDFLR